MKRLRGFIDLVFDAVHETTHLVEQTHDGVVKRSVRRFAPVEPAKSTAHVVTGIQTAIAGTTFKSIRAINAVTRAAVNTAADLAETGLAEQVEGEREELATPIQSTAAGTLSWCADYAEASLNGVFGDYLSRRANRLDLGMTLRDHGKRLPVTHEALAAAFPEPRSRVCVFVHGLAATEWLWSLSSKAHYGVDDVTFGTRLRDDLGYAPLYVRYNSGRHVSDNGKQLAELLDEVLGAYPWPIEEIALVGHSMGGLVSRSAAHYGREHGAAWVDRLRHVACIGSPHLGAPLERAFHVLTYALSRVDAAGAEVPGRLLGLRSAGIKDLRYGYTVDEEWSERDPDALFEDARQNVPLVDGVGYYYLATTISRDPAHPVGQLLGDLLVRLPSAAGVDPEPTRRIPFAGGAIVPGLDHVQIANHPRVYEALRDLLAT